MPKTPPLIYLFHGTDDLALSEAVAQMQSSMGDASLAELNTTRFQGRTVSLADLQAACLAAPFLVRRRLVVVEGLLLGRVARAAGETREAEPQEGDAAAEGEPRSSDWQALRLLLDQIPATTALVFLERGALSSAHPILRWSEEHKDRALVRRFDLPRGAGLSAWVARRAEAQGGSLEPQAAELLASWVGEDPRLLDQEVQKLLAYVNYARPVRPEDVEAVTPEGAQAGIFEMVDALGERRGQKALDLLRNLLLKQSPAYVLAMVVRQFRLLILVREGIEARRSAEALSSELGLHPFVARKLVQQARGFELPVLESIYRKLADLDEAIKTGRVEAGTALDLFVGEVSAGSAASVR